MNNVIARLRVNPRSYVLERAFVFYRFKHGKEIVL